MALFVATVLSFLLLQSWAADAFNLAYAAGHVAIVASALSFISTLLFARPRTIFGWLAVIVGGAFVGGLTWAILFFPIGRPLMGVLVWASVAHASLLAAPVWFVLLGLAAWKFERAKFLGISLFNLLLASLVTVPILLK